MYRCTEYMLHVPNAFCIQNCQIYRKCVRVYIAKKTHKYIHTWNSWHSKLLYIYAQNKHDLHPHVQMYTRFASIHKYIDVVKQVWPMTKLRTKGVHTCNHVDARLQLMRNTHQHIVHVHIRAVEQQLYSNPWKYLLFF